MSFKDDSGMEDAGQRGPEELGSPRRGGTGGGSGGVKVSEPGTLPGLHWQLLACCLCRCISTSFPTDHTHVSRRFPALPAPCRLSLSRRSS